MITNRTVIALALVLLTVAVLAVNGPGISAEKILMGDSNCTVIEDADTVRYTDENCPSRIYIRCESVMDGAFAGVSKLKEVWMDGCVASVGEGAFEGCANLYRFNKGPGPLELGPRALAGCHSLTAIDLRDTVYQEDSLPDTIRYQLVKPGQENILDGICTVEVHGFEDLMIYQPGDDFLAMFFGDPEDRCFVMRDGAVVETEEYYEYLNYLSINGTEPGLYTIIERTYTIHLPEALGADDIVLGPGFGTFDLAAIHPGVIGWTMDGIGGYITALDEEALMSIGPEAVLRAYIGDVSITFDHSAVSGRTDVSGLATSMGYLLGDAYPDLDDVTGYSFAGWEVGEDLFEPGDQVLCFTSHVAKSRWIAEITHSVTYHGFDLSTIVEYGSGCAVTSDEPQAPAGKAFAGWTIEGTDSLLMAGDVLVPVSDVVLVPVFEDLASYSVTLLVDVETVESVQALGGSCYTITAEDPEKEFHRFLGWSCGGEVLQRGETLTVDSDKVLEALWEQLPTSVVMYSTTVSGDLPVVCLTGTYLTVDAEAYNLSHHSFTGWSDGSAVYANGQSILVLGDTILIPVYSEDPRAEVVYHSDGTVLESSSFYIGDEITVSSDAPAREHHVFLGWSTSEDSSEIDYTNGQRATVVSDLHLFAVYLEDPKFALSYHSGDAVLGTSLHYAGEIVTASHEVAVPEHHSLSGWAVSPDSSSVAYRDSDFLTIESDIDLYAVFAEDPVCTVSYIHDGAVVQSQTVYVGSSVIVMCQITQIEHHVFAGWALHGDVLGNGSSFTAERDTELYSVVIEDPKGEITFHGTAGDFTRGGYAGTHLLVPDDNGLLEHHDMIGWSLEQGSSDVYAEPGEYLVIMDDIELFPVYREHQMFVLEYRASGSEISSEAYYMGSQVTVGVDFDIEMYGFTFLGWSENEGSDVSEHPDGSVITMDHDTTLYPVYVEKDKHLLRYNDRGVVRSEAYYDGTYAEVDPSLIPVRSHHAFAGWSETSGSRRADILPGAEILMDRDIDLYPVFREDPAFMVNYLVDGRMVDYAMFYAGSVVAVGTESAPVREHFTLAGWSLDGETLDYPEGSTMVLRYDTDLHAVYVEEPRSVLTYADGARTIGSIELYSGEMVTVGDWVITDNDWRGFIGWKDSETSVVFKNGDRLTIARDTTLQAVWEEPVIVVEPSEDPPAEETPVEDPPAEDHPEEDTEPETVVPASDSPVEVRPDPIQFESSEASGGKDISRIAIVAGILVGVLTGTFAVTRYMRS